MYFFHLLSDKNVILVQFTDKAVKNLDFLDL